MKRSPRFSSFDSQASLAEYAGAPTTADLPPGEASSGSGGVSKSSDYRLYPDERERDRFAGMQYAKYSILLLFKELCCTIHPLDIFKQGMSKQFKIANDNLS